MGSRARKLQWLQLMGSVVVTPGLLSTRPNVWRTGLVAPRQVGSSQITDQTHVSCIGGRILYHWSTKGAPTLFMFSCKDIPSLWSSGCYHCCHTLFPFSKHLDFNGFKTSEHAGYYGNLSFFLSFFFSTSDSNSLFVLMCSWFGWEGKPTHAWLFATPWVAHQVLGPWDLLGRMLEWIASPFSRASFPTQGLNLCLL